MEKREEGFTSIELFIIIVIFRILMTLSLFDVSPGLGKEVAAGTIEAVDASKQREISTYDYGDSFKEVIQALEGEYEIEQIIISVCPKE